MPDAVVIGSGPNGLVAANILRDSGWDVLVLEAQDHAGGAVWSTEALEPGFVTDHCSSFYPLGAASPVLRAMNLEAFGLRWKRSPLVVAHVPVDAPTPAISTDLEETVALLGDDGPAWAALYEMWTRNRDSLLRALFTPFPPIRAGARMMWSMRGREIVRFARLGVILARRLAAENFTTDEATELLAGLAMHADLLPESALSGFFGWLMGCLAQDFGFPVPEGGASRLSQALVRRFEQSGGTVQCNSRVTSITVRNRRAAAVKTADGTEIDVRHAVLCDVDAQTMYLDLLPEGSIDDRTRADVERFQRDDATVKVDWTLDGRIPWRDERARRAATVHVGDGIDQLSEAASLLARAVVPANPFLLLGQMSIADTTRQPDGKETAWAYTHVPQRIVRDAGNIVTGRWDEGECAAFADRMENEIEMRAPGFRKSIRKRRVISPKDFEASDGNLVGGALGGGTSQLHQQLVFRPIPGLARPETPVRGVFLASSSAHPGGGVHGACGANAAHAALVHRRLRRI